MKIIKPMMCHTDAEPLGSPQWRQKGFTLIELAVVLMIVGTLLGVGLSALSSQRVNMAYSETQKNQAFIQDALTQYLANNRRLPCPDDPTNGIDGQEDTCTGVSYYKGVVPYDALKLKRDTVLDGWNNYITYVVADGMVSAVQDPSLFSGTTGAPLKEIELSTGNERNIDYAAVLISHGENEYGAWTQQGTRIDIPNPVDGDFGNYELENTDGDIDLLKTGYTEVADSDNDTPFDDAVYTITKQDLLLPLYKDGRLKTHDQLVSDTYQIMDEIKYRIYADIARTRNISPLSCSLLSCTGGEYSYTLNSSMVSIYDNLENDAWGNPISVTYICNSVCNTLENDDDLTDILFQIESSGADPGDSSDDLTYSVTLADFAGRMTAGGMW